MSVSWIFKCAPTKNARLKSARRARSLYYIILAYLLKTRMNIIFWKKKSSSSLLVVARKTWGLEIQNWGPHIALLVLKKIQHCVKLHSTKLLLLNARVRSSSWGNNFTQNLPTAGSSACKTCDICSVLKNQTHFISGFMKRGGEEDGYFWDKQRQRVGW